MATISNIAKAIILTFVDQINHVAPVLLDPMVKKITSKYAPKPQSKWLVGSLLTERAVDGAIRGGLVPLSAWAKYALPKGLPKEGQRFLAIENDPHTVDDYSGVIKEGYGKGTKALLFSQVVKVKIKDRSFFGKMNLHFHDADVAGPHYDIVVEGVPPGTEQWEINVPNGEYKGRYAFVKTDKGTIVVPMKDRGVVIPKPRYSLKPIEFLEKIGHENKQAETGKEPYVVEWKPDGSLANVEIGEFRSVFRSHRPQASSYYDKLPALEFLKNDSRFALWRRAYPYPDQIGTVIRGELVHPDGVSRVSGILNSLPIKAQESQDKRGAVEFFGWDIQKLRGKDVSHLGYVERRKLLESVIDEVRFFNKHWHIVDACDPKGDPVAFYNKIINDPRGLPYSEGVVVKNASGPDGITWQKVKDFDLIDMEILPDGFIEGEPGVTDKYVGSLGSLRCRDLESGNVAVVGTGFSDYERQWIWDHRDRLRHAVIKAKTFTQTEESFRAPRFIEFHESKGNNEYGLMMYSETLAGVDMKEGEAIRYALKSSAGWRKK